METPEHTGKFRDLPQDLKDKILDMAVERYGSDLIFRLKGANKAMVELKKGRLGIDQEGRIMLFVVEAEVEEYKGWVDSKEELEELLSSFEIFAGGEMLREGRKI